MAANANPLFPLTPLLPTGQTLTAANTAKDGTGTVATLYPAAGSFGANALKIVGCPMGTNTPSVARAFANNGSTNATAGNNILIGEIALPGTTLSEVGKQERYELELNMPIPAGYKINICLGTAVAAGWAFHLAGGADY